MSKIKPTIKRYCQDIYTDIYADIYTDIYTDLKSWFLSQLFFKKLVFDKFCY